MAKAYDVITFGDTCVDLVLTDRDMMPEFGQKEKIIKDYSIEMGGSCCIFASQIAKLGLRTAVLGKLGSDELSGIIKSTLESLNVSTQYLKGNEDIKTGLTVVLNKIVDRGMLTYNGTISAAGIDDFDERLYLNTRHFHIGSYFLMTGLQKHYPFLIDRLKENGTTVSLDTNWDPEGNWDSGLWDILPKIDVFLPNENELMAITQKNTVDKAIDKIKDIIPVIAVKRGKAGASVYYEGKRYDADSLNMPVIDTIGAGDSFDGGFIYSLLRGYSIEDCLKVACICGSYSVRVQGGIKGQALIKDIIFAAEGKYGLSIKV
ncbi:sugar/nucleoside kinase (ribokinase family) [Ruminiclostridium sufflavum DSM 19573]|uniref:Sugar/nucleoside kinase (Ribokinase family) n=1 Tax=Ruminiclostridium sufflavum DSM 19573 TaxID=1121337 RepID=A0A318Y492_9FIRM|nr:sugar kinase [Ruminiclostridium sufflavum]PYG90398.1 sugar/nucleoside kinase (ribokinase family) [Ruminiclostridium sufflavum DSM 19573]